MRHPLKFFILSTFLFSAIAHATIKPIATFSMGSDNVHVGTTSTSFIFTQPLTDLFVGTNTFNTQLTGGIFLGAEFDLDPRWGFQLGASYYQSSPLTQGIDYQLSNPSYGNFVYTYEVTQRRLLGETKLFCNIDSIFHPYVDGGVGESFNDAHGFAFIPTDTGNYSPLTTEPFANHSMSNVTYMTGVGVDIDMTKNIRAGVGYRYADFGKASLGTSPLQVNSATLKNNTLTSNEVLFQVSIIC